MEDVNFIPGNKREYREFRGVFRIFLRRGTPVRNGVTDVFFFCRIPVVLESRRSSRGGGGVRTHCTLPLDPPLELLLRPSIIFEVWTSRRMMTTSFPGFLSFASLVVEERLRPLYCYLNLLFLKVVHLISPYGFLGVPCLILFIYY